MLTRRNILKYFGLASIATILPVHKLFGKNQTGSQPLPIDVIKISSDKNYYTYQRKNRNSVSTVFDNKPYRLLEGDYLLVPLFENKSGKSYLELAVDLKRVCDDCNIKTGIITVVHNTKNDHVGVFTDTV